MLLRLALLFALALSLQAEDKPALTVEQLQAQIAQDRAELDKLQKLLAAWQHQALVCFAQDVNEKALTPPSRPAPVKPETK